VLPAVIARYLHRTWEVVQSVAVRAGAMAKPSPGVGHKVPRRTIARWLGRLSLSAWMIVQLFATAGITVAPEASTRTELVDALAASGAVRPGQKLAQVAEWIHRVAAGVRLM
jgi:heme A synthase